MTAPVTTVPGGGTDFGNRPGNLPGGGYFGNGGCFGGPGGPGAFATGGITIEGTVESITDSTITLKLDNGQTMQVALDDSTTYHAQSDATADDVVSGGKVLVRLNAGGAANGGGAASAGDITIGQ
jgi:hypothetical protein